MPVETEYYARWHLVIFVLVCCAVFILPPPSVILSFLPDTLRPESLFLIAFLVIRLAFSRRLVKLSLEFSFLFAMLCMTITLLWAVAGLGIHFMLQDIVDIFSFFVYWAVFRYGYELSSRYHNNFIKIITIVLFLVVVIQLVMVVCQRMNLDPIISISSLWSIDYDKVPWLRVTRPHGLTANAISLSILMAMFFSYFLGKLLSQSGRGIETLLSYPGLVFSVLVVILTKSRSGFALLLIIPFFFALSARNYLQRVVISLMKIIGVVAVCIAVLVGAAKISGYQGKFVLGSAAVELVDRIGNFTKEGVYEKEGAVGRIDDARVAFDQLSESPYVGMGPAHALGRSWFHSSYITLLRRYGTIGFIFYLLPYVLTAMQAIFYIVRYPGNQSWPSLVILSTSFCILAGGITNYTFIGEWQMNYLFWLLVGTALAFQRSGSERVSKLDKWREGSECSPRRLVS